MTRISAAALVLLLFSGRALAQQKEGLGLDLTEDAKKDEQKKDEQKKRGAEGGGFKGERGC